MYCQERKWVSISPQKCHTFLYKFKQSDLRSFRFCSLEEKEKISWANYRRLNFLKHKQFFKEYVLKFSRISRVNLRELVCSYQPCRIWQKHSHLSLINFCWFAIVGDTSHEQTTVIMNTNLADCIRLTKDKEYYKDNYLE